MNALRARTRLIVVLQKIPSIQLKREGTRKAISIVGGVTYIIYNTQGNIYKETAMKGMGLVPWVMSHQRNGSERKNTENYKIMHLTNFRVNRLKV